MKICVLVKEVPDAAVEKRINLSEDLLHLSRGDFGRRLVYQCAHDVTSGRTPAARMPGSRLGKHGAVRAHRRSLRAPHVLEPLQVRVGDLAERGAMDASLFREWALCPWTPRRT